MSPRHLSFLETGRSSPSQEMVLRLLEAMDVPLWDRNRLLLAAGFAPAYGESRFEDERLAQVRHAVRLVLDRHLPYPAYAMDGSWDVVDSNAAFQATLETLGFAQRPAETLNMLLALFTPGALRQAIVN